MWLFKRLIKYLYRGAVQSGVDVRLITTTPTNVEGSYTQSIFPHKDELFFPKNKTSVVVGNWEI